MVVGGDERGVGHRKGAVKTIARHPDVRPQAGPVVVVKDHRGTAISQRPGKGQQPILPVSGQDGQADAGEVKRIPLVALRLQRCFCNLKIGSCRTVVTPKAEAALTLGVDLDLVQARHAARDVAHQVQGQSVLRPAALQFKTQGIVTQCGGVPGLDRATAAACQVNRSIEAVTAITLLHGTKGGAIEFQHALTKKGDFDWIFHSKSVFDTHIQLVRIFPGSWSGAPACHASSGKGVQPRRAEMSRLASRSRATTSCARAGS